MITALAKPEPGDGEDPDSLMLLVGLDEKYLEELKDRHGELERIDLPNGQYVRVILLRGADDDDLVAKLGEMVKVDDRCVFEDKRDTGA